MPTETKRLVGPESTIPYRLYSVKNLKSYEQLLSEALGEGNVRSDGRRLDESRTLFAELGCVTQAKGSAYVEMGNTKVVVAVYEPRETPKQNTYDGLGDLYCEVKFSPFSTVNRVQLQPTPEDREMAAAMKRALEPVVLRHLFPNFQIDILAYVVENDGSCLAAILNAASLALADGEIPMYDVLVAVTVAVQGELSFLDPTAAEERLCSLAHAGADHGVVVRSQLPELGQITELFQHGAMQIERLLATIEAYAPAYDALYAYMRGALTDKCRRTAKKHKQTDASQKDLEADICNLMQAIKDDVQIK